MYFFLLNTSLAVKSPKQAGGLPHVRTYFYLSKVQLLVYMYGEFIEIFYSILILYFYLHLHFTSSLLLPDFYKRISCTFVFFIMAVTFTFTTKLILLCLFRLKIVSVAYQSNLRLLSSCYCK